MKSLRKLQFWKRDQSTCASLTPARSVEFASTEKIDQYHDLLDDFTRDVLQLKWAFISDASSLWNFHTECTGEELIRRTQEVYGIDVADIESQNIVEILARIHDRQTPVEPSS